MRSRSCAAATADLDELPNGLQNALRVEHDVLVENTQRQVPASRQKTIPGAVAHVFRPFLVVLPAVGLQHDTILDQHIDSTNAGNGVLDLAAEAGLAQQIAQDRLLPRIHARVNPLAQVPVFRGHLGENSGQVGRKDLALVQGGIERGEGETRFLASDDLCQGVPCADTIFGSVGGVDERSPVQLDAIAGCQRE